MNSYRSILHASDAAKAIKLILEQPIGDTYIICGNESIKILDLVLKVYALNGINITVKDNILYSCDKIVAIIENSNQGIDMVSINIKGKSFKLQQLGWLQNYSLDDIINDVVN